MRNTIVAIAVSVGIFLSAIMAYGQQLTDEEYGIYYDFIKNVYSHLCKKMDEAYSETASKYNISVEKVHAIDNEALKKEPTAREWEIYNDLTEALQNLPKDSSEAEEKRLHGQIADKYGLSQTEEYEIFYRCYSWALYQELFEQ
jgi:hypothetical protein